jgi:hypothetical protein
MRKETRKRKRKGILHLTGPGGFWPTRRAGASAGALVAQPAQLRGSGGGDGVIARAHQPGREGG